MSPDAERIRPASTEELVDRVAELRRSRVPVTLRGEGRGPLWGASAPPSGTVLETAGLAGEVRIEPLDLVLTAGAGVPLARAREEARRAGCDLALDDPPTGACTLGGLIGRGEGRGARMAPAGLRGVLLGVEAVLPDARWVRCGGRVVKNVAGYDTHRLFVGAMGTLGAVTLVHMKLTPYPGVDASFQARFEWPEALARAREVVKDLPHVASIAVEGAMPGSRDARVRVRLCGNAPRVRFLRDSLLRLLPGLETAAGEPEPLSGPTLLRLSVPPGSLELGLAALRDTLEAERLPCVLRIHPDAGEAWVSFSDPVAPAEIFRLAAAGDPDGALFAAIRPAPNGGPAWRPAPSGLAIWSALRLRLDPDRLWNRAIVLEPPRP